MGLKRQDLEVLSQPVFLVALLALVVNDLHLKMHYPSWLTGKLSDFAGLYVFAQFIAALSGIRIARAAIASGVLFVAWKSPAATPLIEFLNSYSPLRVHRTIDYTDLAALCVLPFAVRLYAARTKWRTSFLRYPAAAITMLAIMATSVVPPSYNVRLDLQDPQNGGPAIDVTYAEVDKLLTGQGMRCVACAEGSSYREYFDARGNIAAQLNFDNLDRKLFVSVHTSSPDIAKVRTDELLAKLMELLRQRFENVTVVRTASSYEDTTPRRPTWEIRIEAPSVGFPLSCASNGINHPEIAKALAIFDDTIRLPTAIDLRARRCYPTDARCSLEMCRYVVFGRAIGPSQIDKSIHADSRGYVGWGGTSLYVDFTEYGDGRDQAEEIADSLEKRLRASLSGDILITVTKAGAQPRGARGAPQAARP